jgi:hypothetical protein
MEPTEYDIPYPSPSLSDTHHMQRTEADVSLEHSLVELFLDGDLIVATPQNLHSKKVEAEVVASPTNPHPPDSNDEATIEETQLHTPVAE